MVPWAWDFYATVSGPREGRWEFLASEKVGIGLRLSYCHSMGSQPTLTFSLHPCPYLRNGLGWSWEFQGSHCWAQLGTGSWNGHGVT